eukprot:4775852-Pyramimonas_sp.AAC.1
MGAPASLRRQVCRARWRMGRRGRRRCPTRILGNHAGESAAPASGAGAKSFMDVRMCRSIPHSLRHAPRRRDLRAPPI